MNTSSVEYTRAGALALVTLRNGPVNALSQALVTALDATMADIEADRTVAGVVIVGGGELFCAGGDLTEFDTPGFSAQRLNALLLRIESLDRPVVAALHGAALGGGLELAMACHYRVASPTTRFGQPEVLLGFPPGSFGTQRLPRLVGLVQAMPILLQGQAFDASKALALGLIDRCDERSAREAGIAFAKSLVADASPPRRTRSMSVVATDDARADLEQQWVAMSAKLVENPAPASIIRCLQAGLDSFDEGAAVEARLFDDCRRSPASRALRHLFFAERETAMVPGVHSDLPRRAIERIGIVGAGTMGGGIAMAFANAAMPVTIVDNDAAALERGLARIRAQYEASIAKGRHTRAQVEQRMTLLRGDTEDQSLADCDLLIEAVFEDMALKKSICARLGAIAKSSAIIASNTSTLDVDALARASGRPDAVLGMHFFSPANVMRLLEIVRGEATAPDVLATVVALAKKIGKVPVVSGVCYGFIGNRMAEVYMREAEFLLMEGASPGQVDAAVESPANLGMAMGPCRMLDMAGIDVGAKTVIEWKKSGHGPTDASYRAVCQALFTAGRFGQKTGAGYYRYEGRTAVDDPVTASLCRSLAAKHGIRRRDAIASDEIVERLLYPMINEAAKILEEGMAYRPGDIDVVWTSGYGFPRHRGGPVFMGDEIGLSVIARGLCHYAEQRGNAQAYWTPSPLLERLAAAGRRLSDWSSAQ